MILFLSRSLADSYTLVIAVVVACPFSYALLSNSRTAVATDHHLSYAQRTPRPIFIEEPGEQPDVVWLIRECSAYASA
jgi:hypothetical protein